MVAKKEEIFGRAIHIYTHLCECLVDGYPNLFTSRDFYHTKTILMDGWVGDQLDSEERKASQ